MEHNSLKAYGPSDTNDRDNFMLTFHNSLFYYVCNMNEFMHTSISLDLWNVKVNYNYNCLF